MDTVVLLTELNEVNRVVDITQKDVVLEHLKAHHVRQLALIVEGQLLQVLGGGVMVYRVRKCCS